jgi:hypothetical protein
VTTFNDHPVDHLITNKSLQLEKCGVIDASAIVDHKNRKITDHKLIYCKLRLLREKNLAKFVSYRDFSSFSTADAISMLQNVEWEAVMDIDNAESINEFFSKIRYLRQTCAPCHKTSN